MSIFDKKLTFDEEKIFKEIEKTWNYFWRNEYHGVGTWGENRNYYSSDVIQNKYVLIFGFERDTFFKIHSNLSILEKIESDYSVFINSFIDSNKEGTAFVPRDGRALIKINQYGNLVRYLINLKGYTITEIVEENYFVYKFIPKDKHLIIDKISNETWREQIIKFFSINGLIEKEKILGWFSQHLEGEKRKIIEGKNGYSKIKYFKQGDIKNLFIKLNDVYRHFGKDKTKKTDAFHSFEELSEKEKIKQMNEDMDFLTYLIVEVEKVINNKREK